MKLSSEAIREIEEYLLAHGFSGDIPQNNGHKNWQVIKKLVKNEPFYTFGIKRIELANKNHEVNAKKVRKIVIEASGITIKRFGHSGPGHFSSGIVAKKLVTAMTEIKRAGLERRRIIFATGHPGAMTGLLQRLAEWAQELGAQIVTIDQAVPTYTKYHLDMVGMVFVPSDSCSAAHSHDTALMDVLLSSQTADLVVADHGFAGSALNHDLPVIGFYDTDDPAMPLAAKLGLPVLAVPINDNCYNADGSALISFLIERLGSPHAAAKPRRSRATTH